MATFPCWKWRTGHLGLSQLDCRRKYRRRRLGWTFYSQSNWWLRVTSKFFGKQCPQKSSSFSFTSIRQSFPFQENAWRRHHLQKFWIKSKIEKRSCWFHSSNQSPSCQNPGSFHRWISRRCRWLSWGRVGTTGIIRIVFWENCWGLSWDPVDSANPSHRLVHLKLSFLRIHLAKAQLQSGKCCDPSSLCGKDTARCHRPSTGTRRKRLIFWSKVRINRSCQLNFHRFASYFISKFEFQICRNQANSFTFLSESSWPIRC